MISARNRSAAIAAIVFLASQLIGLGVAGGLTISVDYTVSWNWWSFFQVLSGVIASMIVFLCLLLHATSHEAALVQDAEARAKRQSIAEEHPS